MATMTETSEAPERVALHYAGPAAVSLHANANANPSIIYPDTIVVVDSWAADILTTSGPWSPAAGKALDEALKAAGLPTTGSADEKRDRLAAHEAELAAARAAATTDEAPITDDGQDQDRG